MSYVSFKIVERTPLKVFLGERLKYRCKTYQIFTRVPPLVTLKNKNCLESLYIDGIRSSDQVPYVSFKILEIPPLKVFLGELLKYRCKTYQFLQGSPPCNIEK